MAQLITIFLIAGCATPPSHREQNTPNWHGRLSMQVQAPPDEPQSQQQSFSAAFTLQGSPQVGQLTFYSPLGSTAAAIHWTAEFASLEAQGETRTFTGLSPLIQHLLGTDLPVTALFAWLSGQDLAVMGWEVNLTQFSQGKITAQRLEPLPQAQVRIILDN